MKYSIITPAYNSAETIARCITNVENVFVSDYEHIIINDCSTDETKMIINNEKNKSQHPSTIILLENQVNNGVSYSRNRGIEVAKGKYILFLDADDELEINAKTIFESVITKEPDIKVLRFNHNQSAFKLRETLNIRNINEIPNRVIGSYYLHSSCTQLVNSSLLKNIRYNEKIIFGEDLLFSFNLLNLSNNTIFLNDCLYKYHFSNRSASNKIELDYVNKRLNSINLVYDNLLDLDIENRIVKILKQKKNREISLQLLKIRLIDKEAYNSSLQSIIEEYEKINGQIYDIFSLHSYLVSRKCKRCASWVASIYYLLKRESF